MTEQDLLRIRLKMEALISYRHMMIALNEDRASQGYAPGYGDDAFAGNAEDFKLLAEELGKVREVV